jgi:hypothetical protein
MDDVKNGRPTVMTPTTLQKLEEAFSFGCTDEEACFFAGICKQSLYNFQKENEDFLDRKEVLKSRPVLLARQSVINGIKDNPNLAFKFFESKQSNEFNKKDKAPAEELRIVFDDAFVSNSN